MLRSSKRLIYLRDLKKVVDRRFKESLSRFLWDEESQSEDEVDDFYTGLFIQKSSLRYLYRSKRYRNQDKEYWFRFVDPEILNDDEFRQMFRLNRESFVLLFNKISGHSIFQSSVPRRPQTCKILQLLIFLHFLSLPGSGQNFTNVARMFHVSKGCARRYFCRVLKAIISLKDETIKWPTAEERVEISNRFLVTYGLVDCVGCIDGTLINLSEKPEWMGHDFFHRKCGYGVSTLLVCDDDARINYVYSGWVGSIHDNRIWRNCHMKNHPELFF